MPARRLGGGPVACDCDRSPRAGLRGPRLERLGYVERVPDPSDRRAKLVRATPRGRELYAIAREVVAEIDAEWTKRLGKAKMRRLRQLLEELNAAL
jgi:DNA-binding MarR family transcriptional regulator